MFFRPTKLSTRQFTYSKENRCFVAELSDLGLSDPPITVDLKSHRTHRTRRFVRVVDDRDAEGEVTGFCYRSWEGGDILNILLIND